MTMGMPGMVASSMIAYAEAAKDTSRSKSCRRMTVAELRNYINPTTRYYDSMPADAFIEDSSLTVEEKTAAIFGKVAASNMSVDNLEALLKEMRKVVR